MKPRALVTGATDGIGRALAFELAQQGYNVDVLGRDASRGEAVLQQLQQLHPEGEHQLHLVELATISANNAFLARYTQQHQSLQLLVLNALPHGSKTNISDDGIESTFAVGCVSRYLFSEALEPLLQASDNSRVIHIADPSHLDNINYKLLEDGRTGVGKATFQAFAGCSLLAYHVNKFGHCNTPHEIYHPGATSTGQTKNQGLFNKLFSLMIKWQTPEQAAQTLLQHINEVKAVDAAGKIYKQGERQKASPNLLIGEPAYRGLLEWLEEKTQVTFSTK
ncbi:SDR family NAD(P)-dependent oxidoreductase [Ferrimonas lipolytica]|uniref:SDR family NAD(P)-dependent oxidoreductase n=1 Tax=Ferrimonas lipolytica TaxID=2724191 RepID=A0A6H1UEG6_9GAMM|nr:SDR family NAD(P)-dependent oxidoreductase [Ferrimonas lipolytica]QIZ77485.1 SDR family NAD(P)-dependent oxidoreductase [Ferrimonas lipolytica]